MSRPPRILSKAGLYHIIFRGLNKQNIFEEDLDDKITDTYLMLQVLSDDIYDAVQVFIDLHTTNMESENFHITDTKNLLMNTCTEE